ncbi:MAG: potassium channel family protein [Hyphomicrobiales bacterium]|nr:potassium channel family protein [Hyphomicrobiales bacterium]
MDKLRGLLRRLYYGSSRFSYGFRIFLIIFELALIVFFVAASFMERQTWLVATELSIAFLLTLDFVARWLMSQPRYRYFYKISTWADLVVIGTLILPLITENLLFLRAVRVVRIFRSYHLLTELYEHFTFFRKNRDAIEASLNLLVFIFVMSAVVYVLEVQRHPQINNFIDALYFTVSTLSTTGFGDITFDDTPGRILSIGIMIVGVGLFLRLLQVIFRPSKVRHTCPTCGLSRHEPDAIHCKHCGETINIETEGEG